jgi:hypothetical protein
MRARVESLEDSLELLDLNPSPNSLQEPTNHLQPKLGTNWEQLRPNTGQNGGVGPTTKQDESTTETIRPCLPNLRPGSNPGGASKIVRNLRVWSSASEALGSDAATECYAAPRS